MKNFFCISSILIICCGGNATAQSESGEETSDTTDYRNTYQEEILLEGQMSDEESSVTLDYLENLRKNPLNLNTATSDELGSIPFLNKLITKNILDYRKKIISFKSKRELLKVEGVTADMYEKMKIYLVVPKSAQDIILDDAGNKIHVSDALNYLKFSTRIRSRFIQDLQVKEGFLNGKYEGTKPKIYNQISSKFSNKDYLFEANITVEKDAGEKYINDFVSGFLELKNFKFIKNAVAGDYTLNFAQGISMSSGLSFSKGIEAIAVLKKAGRGIYGYRSSNEVQFFRGGAAELSSYGLDLKLYYSDNYHDASVDTASGEVLSFYYDGYHRTSTELSRKYSSKEKLFGGRMTFEKGNLKLGATYWKSNFSRPVNSDPDKKLFNFSGVNASMLGADYDFIFQNMNFYGEFAKSQSGSVASINTVEMTFYKIAEVVLSYRNYPHDFAPVHSSGFGEKNGNTLNEMGFYAGIKIKLLKGLSINSYFDQFKFPYRTYYDPVSTSGNDFLTAVEWKAAKGLLINFKYKNENKEEIRTAEDESGRSVKRIDTRNQLNARLGFIYDISGMIRLRSRAEYVNVEYDKYGGDNKGILFFSDIRVIPLTGFVFDMRYVIFNTDDYDSRIYEYENDMKGVMSNVALYGKGRRFYILLKYKPLPYVEISGKYAETYIDGAKSTGSGNDKIKSDTNNRLSLGAEIIF